MNRMRALCIVLGLVSCFQCDFAARVKAKPQRKYAQEESNETDATEADEGRAVANQTADEAQASEGVRQRRAVRMQELAGESSPSEVYQTAQVVNIQHTFEEQPANIIEAPFEQVDEVPRGQREARKSIHLLADAMPPAWPHRLGTIKFVTTADVELRPDDADGLLETDNAGTPLSGGQPCFGDKRPKCPYTYLHQAAEEGTDIPFNPQLEDLEIILQGGRSCTPRGRDRYVETSSCTYVDNFDEALFERQYKKGNAIYVGKASSSSYAAEVDFALHWEVSTVNAGESIPVVAPQAFIGFGVDGSDTSSGANIILDLGMAFYTCDPGAPLSQEKCVFRGLINFETEANQPKLYHEMYPGMKEYKPTNKRVRRCPDKPHHMCDDNPQEYSGLIFKEKIEGETVAEYSGEVIGAGGDGDDSWMYIDLAGLARLGITNIALTGHEWNKNPLSKLTGAFFRLAAGQVQNKQGHMQTILYQDLDESTEPPSPPASTSERPKGQKFSSCGMLLGMFSLHRGDAWSFGPQPPAAADQFWQYTSMNMPIKANRLSKDLDEIKYVLGQQVVPVPVEEQAELNAAIGTNLDMDLNNMLPSLTGNNTAEAYMHFPGGAPGAAARTYHFLPEESTSDLYVTGIRNAEVCDGHTVKVKGKYGNSRASLFKETTQEPVADGRGIFGSTGRNYAGPFRVRDRFGLFRVYLQVICNGKAVAEFPLDNTNTFPPVVFTAPWKSFQEKFEMATKEGPIVQMTVRVISSEW